MDPFYYLCSEYQEQQNFASQYIATIQERFKDSGINAYEQFMTIVSEYQGGLRTLTDVVMKVCCLKFEMSVRFSNYSAVMMILSKALSCFFQPSSSTTHLF